MAGTLVDEISAVRDKLGIVEDRVQILESRIEELVNFIGMPKEAKGNPGLNDLLVRRAMVRETGRNEVYGALESRG
jgi:hypothetical protein